MIVHWNPLAIVLLAVFIGGISYMVIDCVVKASIDRRRSR